MEIKQEFVPDPRLGLMDQVRQVLRYYHYAYRTEQTYCDWIVRFIRYHQAAKHPREMGKPEIESFLSHLAAREKVSASTQRQALNALFFCTGMFCCNLWRGRSPRSGQGAIEKFRW